MAQMTEDQIEARAERAMDRLDRRLLAGELSQADYDREVQSLAEATQAAYVASRGPVAAFALARPVIPSVDAIVSRHYLLLGSDLCDWARTLIEARWRADWPGFRADRLRQAAEYRQSIARDLAWSRRGREGLRACLVAQGIPVNW